MADSNESLYMVKGQISYLVPRSKSHIFMQFDFMEEEK